MNIFPVSQCEREDGTNMEKKNIILSPKYRIQRSENIRLNNFRQLVTLYVTSYVN